MAVRLTPLVYICYVDVSNQPVGGGGWVDDKKRVGFSAMSLREEGGYRKRSHNYLI